MGLEKPSGHPTIDSLEHILKVDGVLSHKEKQSLIESYFADKNSIVSESKKRGSELRNFLLFDVRKVVERLLGKNKIALSQKMLGLEPDGIFGPKTFVGVIDFQNSIKSKYPNIKVDGILGPQTFNFLKQEKQKPTKNSYTNKDAPRAEQKIGKNEKILRISKTKNVVENSQENLGEILTLQELSLATIWIQKNLSEPEMKQLAKKLPGVQKGIKELAIAVAQYQNIHKKDLFVDGKPGKKTLRHIGVEKKTLYERELQSANKVIQDSEKYGGIDKLKGRWKLIYQEMYQSLRPSERQEIMNGKPFSLVDARTKELLFVYGKKQIKMDVILGSGGFTRGEYVELDKKTPINMVHRFGTVKFSKNRSKSLLRPGQPYYPDLMPADNAKWRRLYFDSKNSTYRGEKLVKGKWKKRRVTVVGVSFQSPESMGYGGRYFHLVGPGRNATWGCVGIKYKHKESAKKMAEIIQKNKGGFGYVSRI